MKTIPCTQKISSDTIWNKHSAVRSECVDTNLVTKLLDVTFERRVIMRRLNCNSEDVKLENALYKLHA